MILVLTPNPALDLTYAVDRTRTGHEHRVQDVRVAAGGKGVNVARVLAALGQQVTVTGPLGGATGSELRGLLEHDPGVDQAWVGIGRSTRRTVTVLDADSATGFNEPGPELTRDELDRVLQVTLELAARASALVISGSLPRGWSPQFLATLVPVVQEHGAPVLVDTSGPALLAAVAAGADLVKPNAREAGEATDETDPLRAGRALLAAGARGVVCSLGADGMLALSPDAPVLRARLDPDRLGYPVTGNPTGAGDSAVAVLARAFARHARSATGAPTAAPIGPEDLRDAVAVSASALSRPIAGEIDPDLAATYLPAITTWEVP
jgi:1-phosphofructokinase family hexose kinase